MFLIHNVHHCVIFTHIYPHPKLSEIQVNLQIIKEDKKEQLTTSVMWTGTFVQNYTTTESAEKGRTISCSRW